MMMVRIAVMARLITQDRPLRNLTRKKVTGTISEHKKA
jgi:hypothetical protein